MIKDIISINLPDYASIISATASMTDMEDRTITMQVKIDGAIVPDFSYDWEVEFKGERYIQPLREPQANKGNESMYSTIDLTFYHKGIYELKRYFFVSIAEVNAGTMLADNYIVPMRLNLGEFVDALKGVLAYYYGNKYQVHFDAQYEYDPTDRKDIDINYTKIWDLLLQVYELYGVRWTISQEDEDAYYIDIAYPSTEVTHVFEYGFEGGLLKFERQVQNAEIANKIFGRGSSENIPYRYFKNVDPNNTAFPADPDWIPELANVYFANLRGKTFRDYVRGWKCNPNRDTLNGTLKVEQWDVVEFLTNRDYYKGCTDEKFAPVEYIESVSSIERYGEIQKGLEHNEEIKPSIQGVSIDDIGRVDQVVDVEPILVDESTENTEWESKTVDISDSDVEYSIASVNRPRTLQLTSQAYQVPQGHIGYFVKDSVVEAREDVQTTYNMYVYSNVDDTWEKVRSGEGQQSHMLKCQVAWIKVINADNGIEIENITNIIGGTRFYIHMECEVSDFYEGEVVKGSNYPYYGAKTETYYTPKDYCNVTLNLSWQLDYTPINGQILGNYENGTVRLTKTKTIDKGETSHVEFITEEFTIDDKHAPATNIDMPFRVTSSLDGVMYDARPNITAMRKMDDGAFERMTSLKLEAGTYKLRNVIQIDNFADKTQTFKVELLPTYIYYSYDSNSWKPTFDIWVKNIWNTMPDKGESDEAYAHRIWDAILGTHLGDDAKVVFSTGRLSGYNDWEFPIAYTPVRDTSKSIDGVASEWKITLYKSDAEMETTGKWLPSIMTQATAGDYFHFVGIELPHQYVLWAEKKLDDYKNEELRKVHEVKPTIVVGVDKVRLNAMQEGESQMLLNALRVGNNIRVADSRFISSPYEVLHLQSITYTWDSTTIMLPNIEVVLSDDVVKASNPIANINKKVNVIASNQAKIAPTINKANKAATRAEVTARRASAQITNVEDTAIQAQILADKASENSLISKDAAYMAQKGVNTLVGTLISDAQKSAREIATEVMSENMPTQVATATERLVPSNPATILRLEANVLYEWMQSFETFTFPTLSRVNANYDNKWMVRFASMSSDGITYPFSVLWKDGIPPSWDTWCTCEMTFTTNAANTQVYGEWKIYK